MAGETKTFELYDNQRGASNKLLEHLTNGERWLVLLAQAQSGKSGTYLNLAIDSIESGLYEQVIIITGVDDISLYEQVNKNIQEVLEQKYENSVSKYNQMKQQIKHLKPSELKRAVVSNNTLIIHDESHYAQSTMNRPYKFFKKIGLDGCLLSEHNIRILDEKNIAILSVSATPFSELIQNTGDIDKKKKIVKLYPGDTYKGAGKLNIHYVEKKYMKNVNVMRRHLEKDKYVGKYVIIRTSSKKDPLVGELCGVLGADRINIFGGDNYECLDVEPVKDKITIVHMCGKGRLGQVFAQKSKKKYIGAVVETSYNPKTDTAIQGLLGRMCGYYDSEIDIFISQETEDEMDEYIRYWSSPREHDPISIHKAMNVVKSKSKNSKNRKGYFCRGPLEVVEKEGGDEEEVETAIEMRVPIDLKRLSEVDCDGKVKYDRDTFKNHLETEKDYILSTIDDPTFKGELDGYLDEIIYGTKQFIMHNLNKNTYKGIENDIKKACKSKTQYAYYKHAFTNNEEETPITIFYNKTNKTLFLTWFSKSDIAWKDIDRYNRTDRPTVTDKCIYNVLLEDKTELDTNGGQFITAPVETGEKPEEFKRVLIEFINRTEVGGDMYVESAQCLWGSLYDHREHKSKGVSFNKDVFTETMLNNIIRKVESETNTKIKTSKFRGRQVAGYIRFKSIRWEFKK